MIISGADNVTLVGAASVDDAAIEDCLRLAPVLVAADGGAAAALRFGMPQAVIGDFDSIDSPSLASVPEARLHRVPEQDTTDFQKCLARIEAPLVLAAGFLGQRVDHTLAAFTALVRYQRPCLLVGRHDVCFHLAPGRGYALDLPVGTRLSLFPMAEVSGESEGLRWPVAGLRFAPGGVIGTSNEVTGPVRLRFGAPGMVAIMPRAALAEAAAALTRARAR